jgi:hypothetical protein
LGAEPGRHPPQAKGAGYTDRLIAGIKGAATPQQADEVRTLLARLQQDPRGKIVLSAMQAYHARYDALPTIVLEPAGRSRPALARPVAGKVWHLDVQALNNGSIADALRELAAVYNNMTGAGPAVDVFQSYTQNHRDRLDPHLEKAWDGWIDAVRSGGRLARIRRSVVQQLRIDLKERQCYGGLSRDGFTSLMRAIQFGSDELPPQYAPIVIRMLPGHCADRVPDMGPFHGKHRIHLPGNDSSRARASHERASHESASHDGAAHDGAWNERAAHEAALHETALPAAAPYENALPPLPDDLQALCLDGIRRPDLTALPSGLRVLLARNACIGQFPSSLPPRLEVLDLSDNELAEVPATQALPATLEVLRLARNPLAELPRDLPGGLIELDVGQTDIGNLPPLPAGMRRLVASDCDLEALPENLPRALEYIDASRNRIRSLPDDLPLPLRTLDLSSNHLGALPACIARLVSCTINLELNRIPARDIPRPPDGQPGPRIHFSMADEGRGRARSDQPGAALGARTARRARARAVPPPPRGSMQAGVTRWLGGTSPRMAQARAQWGALGDPPESADFRQLLDRLHTLRAARDAAFRDDVTEWLIELSMPDRKVLRDDTFAACAEATTRCEDRVAWTFNQLKALWQNDDIRRGLYDRRVGDVVAVARQMFRLEVLAEISRLKVASMAVVDEIEVYLAYAVQLRNALQLTTVVPDMRFYTVSHVTADDLADALQTVQTRERADFDAFLALDYEPWQTLLARLLGDRFQRAQQRMQEALDARFEADLRAALLAHGVDPDDDDGRRTAGVAVLRNIGYGVLGPLTRECIRSMDAVAAPGPAYAESETMVTSL